MAISVFLDSVSSTCFLEDLYNLSCIFFFSCRPNLGIDDSIDDAILRKLGKVAIGERDGICVSLDDEDICKSL